MFNICLCWQLGVDSNHSTLTERGHARHNATSPRATTRVKFCGIQGEGKISLLVVLKNAFGGWGRGET